MPRATSAAARRSSHDFHSSTTQLDTDIASSSTATARETALLRAYRAGCGDAAARRNAVHSSGGWLLGVCPDTYANNVVATAGAVCAPRHQAFMNHTRRSTGSTPARS